MAYKIIVFWEIIKKQDQDSPFAST